MKKFMMLLILIPVLSHSMENSPPSQEETGTVMAPNLLPITEHEYKGICVKNGRDYTLGCCGGFSLSFFTSVPLFSALIAAEVIYPGWGALGIGLGIGSGIVAGIRMQQYHYDKREGSFHSLENVVEKHSEL